MIPNRNAWTLQPRRNINPQSTVRKYPEIKLQENLDSEIMEVLLQEARDSYDEEIVVELQSNTSEDMDTNIDRIEAWLKQWKENNASESS